MKTREEILESVKRWYAMGAEKVEWYDDKVARCLVFHLKCITQYTIDAIAGENFYAINPNYHVDKYGTKHFLNLSVNY